MSGFLVNLARRAVGLPEALAPQPSRSAVLAEGMDAAAPVAPAMPMVEAPTRPMAESPAAPAASPVIRRKQAAAPASPGLARLAPVTVQPQAVGRPATPLFPPPAAARPIPGGDLAAMRPAEPEAIES